MKRKPPKDDVRRFKHIQGNRPSTYVNKANRTVQCESFLEYKLVVTLDNDPSVKDFISQPEKFHFISKDGQKRSYVPDYLIWRADESIEIHEVTVQERRESKVSIAEREIAAENICGQRGWKYVVHTDKTLPSGSKWANLDNLVAFRPKAYNNIQISKLIASHLSSLDKIKIFDLIRLITEQYNYQRNQVCSTLLHMIWHGYVKTDMCILLFIDSSPNKQAKVWIIDEVKHDQ